jgi:hypothetical protein
MMKEALSFSETSVLTRSIRRNIPEDAILHRIYKIVILSVVLYGCEKWSLTLWEEYKLRVFENRTLMKIYGPKREVLTGGWRKLHDDDTLHDF